MSTLALPTGAAAQEANSLSTSGCHQVTVSWALIDGDRSWRVSRQLHRGPFACTNTSSSAAMRADARAA